MKTKELHIRVEPETFHKIKQLTKINNVTVSDTMRYVLNHYFHKHDEVVYQDTWVAIINQMGALSVAPYYFTSRKDCKEQFPKALSYINLKDFLNEWTVRKYRIVNIYLDKMLPPQTITMTVEGVQAHFWVVTFMEVFADGSTITKYGMYSYN